MSAARAAEEGDRSRAVRAEEQTSECVVCAEGSGEGGGDEGGGGGGTGVTCTHPPVQA